MPGRNSMKRTLRGLVAGICLLLTAGTATAVVMYGGNGNDGSAGALVTIDQTTGQGTLVGTPVPDVALSGLAFNSNTDLFGSTIDGLSSTSTLIRINPDTGTLLATVGPITVAGVPISIGDLSFQPGTGVLYGLRSNADPAKLGGRLYTINTTTGVATLVGSTGATVGGGIAFAPNGTLYQTTLTLLGVPVLNTLNPATGAVITSVPDTLFFDSLGIRPDGTIFASDGNDTIYTINPTTGTPTLIGLTHTGHPSDLDFRPEVPEPGSLGLLCLGTLGLLGYRYRRRKQAG
jgi:hypothetical protein